MKEYYLVECIYAKDIDFLEIYIAWLTNMNKHFETFKVIDVTNVALIDKEYGNHLFYITYSASGERAEQLQEVNEKIYEKTTD
jgi:predicted double-glycine peptidase